MLAPDRCGIGISLTKQASIRCVLPGLGIWFLLTLGRAAIVFPSEQTTFLTPWLSVLFAMRHEFPLCFPFFAHPKRASKKHTCFLCVNAARISISQNASSCCKGLARASRTLIGAANLAIAKTPLGRQKLILSPFVFFPRDQMPLSTGPL